MLTVTFWNESFQRAIRTFAQTVLAGFGGASLNVWSANWHQVLGLGLGAALLSVLMSIDRSGSGASTPQASLVQKPLVPDHLVPVVTCADKP